MQDASPLPVVAQPRGLRYVFGTWSGRLILLCFAVFVFTCVKTGTLLWPTSEEALIALGAKDPVKLAQGEVWRLFLPMFIHIGALHFAVNMYFLYVVGYQLEKILGGPWFLAVYLLSGVAGNVASAVFSINLSAGASSSLFGLLGAGLFLERTIGSRILRQTGQRPRNRGYLMTVLINLAFGFIVPFIDNSAHLGGLAAGVLLTFAMVNLRPNNLQPRRRAVGVAVLVALAVVCAAGAYYGTSPRYVLKRVEAAAASATEPDLRVYRWSQALSIMPDDARLHVERARALFDEGEKDDDAYAYHDVRAAVTLGGQEGAVQSLADELDAKGRKSAASQVRLLAQHPLRLPQESERTP